MTKGFSATTVHPFRAWAKGQICSSRSSGVALLVRRLAASSSSLAAPCLPRPARFLGKRWLFGGGISSSELAPFNPQCRRHAHLARKQPVHPPRHPKPSTLPRSYPVYCFLYSHSHTRTICDDNNTRRESCTRVCAAVGVTLQRAYAVFSSRK